MNSAEPGDGEEATSEPIRQRAAVELNADHHHTAACTPGEETARWFQTGTVGLVRPLTCERNQTLSPSPHYCGQPGSSNSISQNISPLSQCSCLCVVVVVVVNSEIIQTTFLKRLTPAILSFL